MRPVIPIVKARVIPGMISIAPVSWRTPATTGPHPMVIAPSPTTTHPDVARCGAGRQYLNYRCRHWRCYHDRGRRHHYRRRSHDHGSWGRYHHGRSRDAEADTEMNPCVHSGDSQSCQGQNCNSLFHIHWGLDALDGARFVTNRLTFCNARNL